ncbi:hypothetical protein VTN02DRAFT_6660 [Thermoascus thermophilus]
MAGGFPLYSSPHGETTQMYFTEPTLPSQTRVEIQRPAMRTAEALTFASCLVRRARGSPGPRGGSGGDARSPSQICRRLRPDGLSIQTRPDQTTDQTDRQTDYLSPSPSSFSQSRDPSVSRPCPPPVQPGLISSPPSSSPPPSPILLRTCDVEAFNSALTTKESRG